jgi:hypothetical protein
LLQLSTSVFVSIVADCVEFSAVEDEASVGAVADVAAVVICSVWEAIVGPVG